jgi:hypothetical protein
MDTKRSLAAFAVTSFLVSLISLVLAIKTDLTISHRRAQLVALENASNKPEYRKAIKNLKDRIRYLQDRQFRPRPTWVSQDDVRAEAMADAITISETRGMLDALEGAAERGKTVGENEIRQRTPWLYILYSLAFTMATVGVIILRHRASLKRSTVGSPLSIIGQ